MVDEEKAESTDELPGLPLKVFEAGVRALAELRDTGQYMVFVGPRKSVKFLGDAATFRQTLADRLDDEIDVSSADDALTEIKDFCQSRLVFESLDSAVEFWVNNLYYKRIETLGEDAQLAVRDLISRKMKLVSTLVHTDALRGRVRRMETATTPCVEELDAELVTLRHDGHRDQAIEQPFLRVRLRYSRNDQAGLPFLPRKVFGPFAIEGVPSFEFECDESDIDLLISRLREAKQLLLNSDDEPLSRQQD